MTSSPESASTWYPVNDHPCDKATYSFRITVPKPYVVGTNGVLQDTVDNGATSTYVSATNYPVASYLAAVNIADFTVVRASGPNGLPLRSYFPRALAGAAGLFDVAEYWRHGQWRLCAAVGEIPGAQ